MACELRLSKRPIFSDGAQRVLAEQVLRFDRAAMKSSIATRKARSRIGNVTALLRKRDDDDGAAFKSSDKPLFVYVQTMTAHAPYKQPYLPDEQVTGGGPWHIRLSWMNTCVAWP